MVFSSTVFLFLFLPITILVYYNPIIQTRKFRNIFLLMASMFFYAWGEPFFVILMLVSILVGWYIGKKMDASSKSVMRRKYLFCGVCFHVGLLFVFKYLGFTVREMGEALHQDVSWFQIALPIGISFFTFQLLSYLFDIYYGKAHAQKSILDLGLYIALFPQLIAGPIVRYNDIKEQILYRKECLDDFSEGMIRFIYGLGKKVLIANYLAQIADNIFDAGVPMSAATAWLGAVAYTLQIYFDFSGYSDMAIGLGRMFGFRFVENFNYPYIANSITDFWRRWHISLSTWFRDYVYIPLGGNRVSFRRWILNLAIVWALTGVWHGANWTFLLWGLYYFLLLFLEKKSNLLSFLGRGAYVYTICAVILGWTMFRSNSVTEGVTYIGMMFGIGSTAVVDDVFLKTLRDGWSILLVGTLLSFPIFPWLRKSLADRKWWLLFEPCMALGIFMLSLLITVSSSYNPFIYFNF